MPSIHLYFIALVPHYELREEIKRLKEEMKERFNAGHALKSPAHITLQLPFKRSTDNEQQIIHVLSHFASRQTPFLVELSDFACFAPRVIFVNIKNPQPIIDLHVQLKELLVSTLGFEQKEISQEVHPHMTIATRDLDKAAFKEAWAEFLHRIFKTTFTVESIFLLKHNGRQWDIYREFSLL
ncbi:2'-5' RNA ligase family protein [Catalinimonas niigatensis]|uniref:2'-5' RNA ligase family protein n=1 Tax=Catalinimonas niigatensis TaxID=1397264 RepID=UPI002665DB0C|nr:2'-5' RNA ligase family protein [Catalinimonas niigatensis]WPP51184.1 2'-5' RNA ligase family protein [Catalinimonas niigatensis]